MARAARRGNEHIVAPHARTCIGGTGLTSQNTTAVGDASGRGFDSSCDHRARGEMAPRRGRTRRVLVGPPSHGLRLVRQRISSGQAGFDVHGLGQGRHSLVAITVLSGRSLPQEACGPAAGTSRKRIFSRRIDPSRRPDRAGSRGQVSAVSWGISPAKFRPSLDGARKRPRHSQVVQRGCTQRTSLHRTQARANDGAARKMRTSISRPSRLVVADPCRPLARRGSAPGLSFDAGHGPMLMGAAWDARSVLRMSILRIEHL
jgi:hypothetical protein